MDLKFLHELIMPSRTKIVMVVMDGLGGLPAEPGGQTELEFAQTPNLDALAAKSALGLNEPVGPGITVESGPGHLGLFGYDPLVYRIGRGVLEAVGVGFNLGPDDIALRGNYCCVDASGVVQDRRAGRIANDISKELSRLITTRIEGIDVQVETVREHRLAIVMRGTGLSADVTGSDPLKNGYPPLTIRPLCPEAEKTAKIINQFVDRSRQVIEAYQPKPPANMLLMRGIDRYPNIPLFPELYELKAAAIAIYPTYRGIAQLVGMQVLQVGGNSFDDEFNNPGK